MTEDRSQPSGSGEERARCRRKRVWAAMVLPGLSALVLLLAAREALGVDTSGWQATPAFAVIFAIVISIAVVVGAVWHHRVIDEQEERAILWGNTTGFYTAIVSAMVADVFAMAGMIPPISHVGVFVGSFAIAVLTYVWLRFR